MAKSFTQAQWNRIFSRLDANPNDYWLPARRAGSIVLASFNIRKFGAFADNKGKQKRSHGAWKLLTTFCGQCDLIAIQEVLDSLESLRLLRDRLPGYKIVVSDIAGGVPGRGGSRERLAFLYNSQRVTHTELSSDISFERTAIFNQLYKHQEAFTKAYNTRTAELAEWERKAKKKKQQGKRAPRKPPFVLPEFVQFIRTPHLASFEVPAADDAKPYEIICANAHLMYGDKSKQKKEREREFKALISWLLLRAREKDKNYVGNMILFGDLNLDFKKRDIRRRAIEKFIISLNSDATKLRPATKVNFPFLDDHPNQGVIRTNARRSQTYDQIALFGADDRFPPPQMNIHAGEGSRDDFNFGMFDFVQLFADAVPQMHLPRGKIDYSLFEYDVSDHMPIWIRLPIPHMGQVEFRWR